MKPPSRDTHCNNYSSCRYYISSIKRTREEKRMSPATLHNHAISTLNLDRDRKATTTSGKKIHDRAKRLICCVLRRLDYAIVLSWSIIY